MPDSRASNVCLWFTLVFPSSFIVDKYLGWECTIAYAIVVAAVVALQPNLSGRLSSRSLLWLALLTLLLTAGAFLVIYPVANTHAPGTGSDDDDALNLGAMALLTGRFPYSRITYLGNVLHHFAGAFVLAAPFVILGTSALQNLFWLPLFFLAVREETSGRTALQLAWLILALSPGVMHEVVTGTGYVSNTIYVLLGLWWLVRTKHRDAAAIAWGVTLASRANFLLLVPLAFGYLRQTAGLRTALRATALTCATAACLIIPFYLHDRRNFGPIEGANRLLVFNGLVPHLGLAVVVLMAALAFVLAFTPMDVRALFRNGALVQAFPVVAGVALTIVQDRQLNLSYARYGSFFAWFTLMALYTEGHYGRPDFRHPLRDALPAPSRMSR
jgi:dipeptide/tripeptide permease